VRLEVEGAQRRAAESAAAVASAARHLRPHVCLRLLACLLMLALLLLLMLLLLLRLKVVWPVLAVFRLKVAGGLLVRMAALRLMHGLLRLVVVVVVVVVVGLLREAAMVLRMAFESRLGVERAQSRALGLDPSSHELGLQARAHSAQMHHLPCRVVER